MSYTGRGTPPYITPHCKAVRRIIVSGGGGGAGGSQNVLFGECDIARERSDQARESEATERGEGVVGGVPLLW